MVDIVNSLDKRTEAKGAEEGHADWTRHAPSGGIQINGAYYGGGKFIPNEELKKASPEEIAELNRRIELSDRLGPEQAKKIINQEKQAQTSKLQEQNKEKVLESVQENVYIIDDGTLYGGQYGELVIKRSTKPIIEINKKEAEMLNTLGTKRFDVIFPDLQKVTSISADEWPLNNTLQNLQNNIQEIAFTEYSLFNNMSAKTKNYFGYSSSPSRMCLYRLSLNKNIWEVENSIGKKYSLRTLSPIEAKTVLFIHNVYNYFGVPTSNAVLHEEGLLEDCCEQEDSQNEKQEIEEDHIQDTLNGMPLDSLFGIKPTIRKKGKRIIRENIEPNILKNKNKLGSFPEDKSKEIKEKLTPALIDELLEKINYPVNKRRQVSLQLLEGLQ